MKKHPIISTTKTLFALCFIASAILLFSGAAASPALAYANQVTGQVKDTAQNPIASIEVRLHSEAAGVGRAAVTDGNGRYVISDLPPAGDYRASVRAEIDGRTYEFYHHDLNQSVIFFEAAALVNVPDATHVVGVDIIVGKQGGTISGQVTDIDGQPIAGAEVRAWSEKLKAGGEAWTDETGAYEMWGLRKANVLEDSYIVEASAKNYVRQFYSGVNTPEAAVPVPDGFVNIDFALSQGAHISGVVKNTQGYPVPDATVRAWSALAMAFEETRSGSDGAYILPSLPPASDYIVSAQAADYQTQWYSDKNSTGKNSEDAASPVDLSYGDVSGVNFSLSEGSVIFGRIYIGDQNHPAPEGMEVLALSNATKTESRAKTNTEGGFRIIGLDPDVTDYILAAHHPGNPPVYYREDMVGSDNIAFRMENATPIAPSTANTRDMVLPPGVSIRGKVVLNKMPVAGVKVEARAYEKAPDSDKLMDYGWGEAFTQAEAVDEVNYEIKGLRPGPQVVGQTVAIEYKVSVHLPKELSQYAAPPQPVDVADADVNGVNFELAQQEGRTISGLIYNLADGKKITIRARSEQARFDREIQITGDGSDKPYQIASLIPASDYVVELRSPDYPPMTYGGKSEFMKPDMVDVSETDAAGVDFTLPDAGDLGTISGQVVFPEDAALGEDARVEAISHSTGVRRETVVRRGLAGPTVSYDIQALVRADDYLVSIRPKSYKFHFYPDALREADAQPVDISVEDADAIDFTLTPGLSISGQVVQDGAGVALTEVHAWSPSTGTGGHAKSALDGSFTIQGLEAIDDYTLEVNDWRGGLGSVFYHPDGAVRDRNLAREIDTTQGNVSGLEIVLDPGQSISGSVANIEGARLANVRVSAWSDQTRAGNGVFTADDGTFEIKGLPDGIYDVSAKPHWSSSYLTQTRTNVYAGNADVDFRLMEKTGDYVVSGKVTNADLVGVQGATVEMWPVGGAAPSGWTLTNGNGDWEISEVAEGDYRIVVHPPSTSDLAVGAQETISVAGETTAIAAPEVALPPGQTIFGTVQDADGNLVASAEVRVVSISTGFVERTHTNSEGVYEIDHAPVADDYVGTVFEPGYSPEEIAFAVSAPDGALVNFTLNSGNAISGKVLDVDGEPLSDVLVEIYAAGRKSEFQFSGSARTNEDGAYSIEGLRCKDASGAALADYTVTAPSFTRYDDDGSPIRYLKTSISGRKPGDTVDLSLSLAEPDSSKIISGTVTNPTALGGDYVAVDLFVVGDAGRFDQHQTIRDSDGAFSFKGLEPGGQYTLGFGVYVEDDEEYFQYQWAGPSNIGVADADGLMPPDSAQVYAPGTVDIAFSFNTNLRRQSQPGLANWPGTVNSLRIAAGDIDAIRPNSTNSSFEGGWGARSTAQNLARTPAEAVTNSPTITVTWEPSSNGTDEKYYYVFNNEDGYAITKRNAPQPSVDSRKAVSNDLSGDEVSHYFHIAVEDDRGRIGATESLSFIVDTVAPRNASLQAATGTDSNIVTLELGADGASEIYVSNTHFGEGGQWENFVSSMQWELSDVDDPVVYVQFRDEARNTANAAVSVDVEASRDYLSDVIVNLQVLAGLDVEGVDADGSGVVDLGDVIYLLGMAAGR